MKHFVFVSYAFHGRPKEYQGVGLGRNQLVGGAEIYLYDLSRMLLNDGHQVTVIQAGADNDEYDWEGIHIRQIRFRWIGGRLGLPEQWWGFNRHWIHALPKTSDHVHLHYLQHAWPSASADMTATCHGITWDIPNDESAKLQMNRYPKLMRPLRPLLFQGYTQGERWLAQQGLKRVRKIASVDTALIRFAEQHVPVTAKKISYIPNYVDTTIFHPDTSADVVPEVFKNRRIILFPRMLSFNRGAHLLVPAMKNIVRHFPDSLLVVIGSGNAEGFVRQQVQENNLGGQVIFLGHLDHDQDMPKYYRAAEIVIIPSIGSEGTSLACLEAMASRKPIIAGNVGGLPDLITDRQNGLLIQPSAENLSESILTLLQDAGLREKLATRARLDALNTFNQERWASSYRDFFRI